MNNKIVKLLAVGDIFLGEHPFTLNHGVTTITKTKGCDYLFQYIKNYLADGDIVCGNLEGIISSKKNNETGIKSAIFWGEPGCAEAMQKAGFNCLFLANNHTAQHGIDALKRTCSLLDNNQIKWTGFNPSQPDKPQPVIFTIKGIKIGILAYCETQQYHLEKQILPLINLENINKDIASLKTECDIVIISLHWGDEFIEYPSPQQVNLAHEIINSGASIILGHHSHSLQGIEEYNNGIIVYSLGTFIKDLWRKELRQSVIFECEITKDKIISYDVIPIFISDNYQPEIITSEAGKNIKEKINILSRRIESNKMLAQADLQKIYQKEVKKLERKDKLDNLLHYIKNIYRYDKKLLFENLGLIIKRRLYRKNI